MTEPGERLAVVETRVDGLERAVSAIGSKVDVVVAEMHRLRGAVWTVGSGLGLILSIAALVAAYR